MSILDLRLNLYIAEEECTEVDTLADQFRHRAKVVRDGVRGSPRGEQTPRISEYTGYFVIPLPGAYEIVAEQLSEVSGLPLNECAKQKLGCEFYGPVFLIRRVCGRFVPLKADFFDTEDGQTLTNVAHTHFVKHQNSVLQSPSHALLTVGS